MLYGPNTAPLTGLKTIENFFRSRWNSYKDWQKPPEATRESGRSIVVKKSASDPFYQALENSNKNGAYSFTVWETADKKRCHFIANDHQHRPFSNASLKLIPKGDVTKHALREIESNHRVAIDVSERASLRELPDSHLVSDPEEISSLGVGSVPVLAEPQNNLSTGEDASLRGRPFSMESTVFGSEHEPDVPDTPLVRATWDRTQIDQTMQESGYNFRITAPLSDEHNGR